MCCRIQCTDSLHPNGPRQRRKLFTAALKLLRFAIGIETVCCENEEQRALQTAFCEKLKPLRFKLIFSMTYVTKYQPQHYVHQHFGNQKLQLPNHVRFTSLFEKPLASLGQSALLLGTHGAVSYPDLRSAAEQNKDQRMTFLT